MRWPPVWLVGLLLLMAFAFQGTRGIWEPDEGRYAATALNMLEGGDWLVPTLDGEHAHLTKPPIVYWSIAASVGALGRNEWAVRLPAALAFVGTGLLVFGLGRRLSPQQPWLPALIWSLSLMPLIGSNVVSTDSLLMLFETAAMFAFVEAWSSEGAARRRWMLAMWLGWGLAFMTKGPPGLLPLVAMVAFLAVHDRPRLRGFVTPAGLAVFAVVAFTWFVLVVREDPGRLGYFLGYEVYDRVFTSTHDRNAEWYGGFEVYLPVLLLGAMPWPVLAVAAAGGPRAAWRTFRARVGERDRHALLLLYWFALPLAVFFVARSRLQLYILPLFVPLALAMARVMAARSWPDRRRLAIVAAVTAAALLAVKGTLAYLPSDRDSRRTAAAIAAVVETHGVDEIAFVGLRPFYGLELYLDVRVEAVHFKGKGVDYSRFLAAEGLCAELATRERNLFAVKRRRTRSLLESVAACSERHAVEVGHFQADDNEIVLYAMRAAPGPGG
jgi:4-amino-4-deoxy-L-arabinose transferase